MKSSINQLADYKSCPVTWEVTVSCPEETIQTELHRAARAFKHTEKITAVEAGDAVMLKTVSDVPKFNKAMVPVTVGRGLYSAELEEQLIGRAVGETFQAALPEGTVQVTVLQGTRTVFPEPTDEMAADYAARTEGFEGVTTVEQLRRRAAEKYCRERRDAVVYELMDQIMDYVLCSSDWNFDQEELEARFADGYAAEREALKAERGIDLDTASPEELKLQFGVGDLEELKRDMRIMCEREIASALWCAACNGRDPGEASLEYKQGDFDFLERYVREHIEIKEEL